MPKIDDGQLKKSIMWEYIGEIKGLLSNNNYALAQRSY